MERVNDSRVHLGSALRWTARIWSIGSIALILAFIIGERSLPSQPSEWVGFALFPVGISVGMLLAWRREALGGILTVTSLVAFYLFQFATIRAFPQGAAWLVFAAPGFLFVLASLLSATDS